MNRWDGSRSGRKIGVGGPGAGTLKLSEMTLLLAVGGGCHAAGAENEGHSEQDDEPANGDPSDHAAASCWLGRTNCLHSSSEPFIAAAAMIFGQYCGGMLSRLRHWRTV